MAPEFQKDRPRGRLGSRREKTAPHWELTTLVTKVVTTEVVVTTFKGL